MEKQSSCSKPPTSDSRINTWCFFGWDPKTSELTIQKQKFYGIDQQNWWNVLTNEDCAYIYILYIYIIYIYIYMYAYVYVTTHNCDLTRNHADLIWVHVRTWLHHVPWGVHQQNKGIHNRVAHQDIGISQPKTRSCHGSLLMGGTKIAVFTILGCSLSMNIEYQLLGIYECSLSMNIEYLMSMARSRIRIRRL